MNLNLFVLIAPDLPLKIGRNAGRPKQELGWRPCVMENESMTHRVSCAQCGLELAEKGGLPTAERQPCPSCRSLSRKHHVGLFASLSFQSMLTGKGRESGKRKPFIEFKLGDSFWNIGQKWMNLVQIVDRRKNKYLKHVEDPKTGEVVRHVEEPLTEHKDRGSAKPKNGAADQ